jgi:hypothetical protein
VLAGHFPANRLNAAHYQQGSQKCDTLAAALLGESALMDATVMTYAKN